MGVSFIKHLPLDEMLIEIRDCVNQSGYLFNNLKRTRNWLGLEIIELTFKNSDGSYIDENFYDFNMVNGINEIAVKHGVKVSIPSEYFPK
jgi:hypothetical protein